MPVLTAIFGGLLVMMGNRSRSESLFHYFRVEDQVPENHLLRLIDRYINLDFIRSDRSIMPEYVAGVVTNCRNIPISLIEDQPVKSHWFCRPFPDTRM